MSNQTNDHRTSEFTAKIQYSLCTTGLKSSSLEEICGQANRMGMNGLEIWSGHIEDYLQRGGSLDQLHKLLNSYKLTIPSLSEYCYFTKNKEQCEHDVKRIQRSASWASALQCQRIRIFAGHIPSQSAEQSHWDLLFNGLSKSLQICRSLQIGLAVENHNNTMADCSPSLRRLFDHFTSELELIYDPFNLFVDQLNPLPVLDEFSSKIKHVHVKDYYWNAADWSQSVAVSVLEGDAGHRPIIDRLLALGYNGFISFEYFGQKALEISERSLLELRLYVAARVNDSQI